MLVSTATPMAWKRETTGNETGNKIVSTISTWHFAGNNHGLVKRGKAAIGKRWPVAYAGKKTDGNYCGKRRIAG
jgi:hypothetical protein